MNDHVSIIAPPLAHASPSAIASDAIAADGFFPPVSQSQLRSEAAIDASISPDRLRAAILAAIETALIDLDKWRLAQQDLGYVTLAVVPSRTIDGQSRKVRAWHRAITAFTKAEITETSLAYDATGQGERSIGALDEAITQHRRDAAHAIRDLLGKPRTDVSLI